MTFPKTRLVVSACLFVGWIGFLLYLALGSPTVFISRPQFLVSTHWVTADLQDGENGADGKAQIAEVIWTSIDGDKNLAGKQIPIRNLAGIEADRGYRGAQRYILPLVKRGDQFSLATLPTGGLRVYPESVRTQVDELALNKR